MGCIRITLNGAGGLNTMASPAPGVAGSLPLGMPAGPGLYVIFNLANGNRYIGKAGNLQTRFNKRMLGVNELGLSPANLNQIGAFWGQVTATHTAAPPLGGGGVPQLHTLPFGAAAAPLFLGFRIIRSAVGAAPALPAAVVGGLCMAPNYAAANVTVTVDGQALNVEALLIRFFRQAAGVGGTITNGTYIGNFTNTTANELIVVVEWVACPAVNVPHAHMIITIPPGGAF